MLLMNRKYSECHSLFSLSAQEAEELREHFAFLNPHSFWDTLYDVCAKTSYMQLLLAIWISYFSSATYERQNQYNDK